MVVVEERWFRCLGNEDCSMVALNMGVNELTHPSISEESGAGRRHCH